MFFAKLIGKHLRWNLLLINLKSTGLQLYQKRGSSAVIFLRILRNSLEPLFHGKRSSDCFCYAKFNLGHWSTSLVPMLHFIQKAADVKYGKTLKLKKIGTKLVNISLREKCQNAECFLVRIFP